MYTHVNAFVDGMRKGKTRLSLERADPATLEETFSIALREDFRVTKAYVVRSPVPEVMKIDVIKSSCDRRRATYHKSDLLSERQMICFRSEKPYHRAANCRAPAPITAHVVSTNNEGAAPVACSKQRSEPVRTGRLTG